MINIANENLSASKTYVAKGKESEYRSRGELRTIQSGVENKMEEMATDFVDELEARGVVTSNDYESKQQIVIEVVESYQDKFNRWLKAQ